MPYASMSDVTVSGPTHVIPDGQTIAASVAWISAIATSIPRRIWATGPPSTGAGLARVADAPASAAATAPSGSNDTATIRVAPPLHAASAMRRTEARPSASARADSG